MLLVDREALSANYASARQDTEALTLDAEGDVELAAEVLEGDRRRQLYHLRLREVPAGLGEQLVGDLLARDRHGFGEGERGALGRGVVAAGRERDDLADLVLRGAGPQTAGAVDVDSERAAVDERDAEIDEGEQLL